MSLEACTTVVLLLPVLMVVGTFERRFLSNVGADRLSVLGGLYMLLLPVVCEMWFLWGAINDRGLSRVAGFNPRGVAMIAVGVQLLAILGGALASVASMYVRAEHPNRWWNRWAGHRRQRNEDLAVGRAVREKGLRGATGDEDVKG